MARRISVSTVVLRFAAIVDSSLPKWILVVGTIAAPYSRWRRIARDRYKL